MPADRLTATRALLDTPTPAPNAARQAAGQPAAECALPTFMGCECNHLSGCQHPAAVEETHIVADDSDDPEHVDDCPGCETAVDHDEHCPTPETHNWGCGCPTDKWPGRRVEEAVTILHEAMDSGVKDPVIRQKLIGQLVSACRHVDELRAAGQPDTQQQTEDRRRLAAVERLCSGRPGYHTVTVKELLTAMSEAAR